MELEFFDFLWSAFSTQEHLALRDIHRSQRESFFIILILSHVILISLIFCFYARVREFLFQALGGEQSVSFKSLIEEYLLFLVSSAFSVLWYPVRIIARLMKAVLLGVPLMRHLRSITDDKSVAFGPVEGRTRAALRERQEQYLDAISQIKEIKRSFYASAENKIDAKEEISDSKRWLEPTAELAAVNLFMEKAAGILTMRAAHCIMAGILFLILVPDIVLFSLYYFIIVDPTEYTIQSVLDQQRADSTLAFLIWIVKSGTIAVLISVCLYFCVNYSRAFLHESTVLLNKRHNLRAGRLFLYTKLLNAEPGSRQLANIKEAVSLNDFERLFLLPESNTTLFSKIKPEDMPKFESAMSSATALADKFGKMARGSDSRKSPS